MTLGLKKKKKGNSQNIVPLQLLLSNSYNYYTFRKCNVKYICKASDALSI